MENSKLYYLVSHRGYPLTFDPCDDTFSEILCNCENYSALLKVWDYQYSDDPEIWFMGNNARPKIQFEIKEFVMKEYNQKPFESKTFLWEIWMQWAKSEPEKAAQAMIARSIIFPEEVRMLMDDLRPHVPEFVEKVTSQLFPIARTTTTAKETEVPETAKKKQWFRRLVGH